MSSNIVLTNQKYQNVLASLHSSAFLRSSDAGKTWTVQSRPVALVKAAWGTPMVGVGIAGAATGELYQTIDGGVSWNETGVTGVALLDICMVGPDHGWACGASETIFRTYDGGGSWYECAGVPAFGGKDVQSICGYRNPITGALRIYAAGQANGGAASLMTSTDGSTFTLRAGGGTGNPDGISCNRAGPTPGRVVIAQDGVNALSSVDYGVTWAVKTAVAQSGYVQNLCLSSMRSKLCLMATGSTGATPFLYVSVDDGVSYAADTGWPAINCIGICETPKGVIYAVGGTASTGEIVLYVMTALFKWSRVGVLSGNGASLFYNIAASEGYVSDGVAAVLDIS